MNFQSIILGVLLAIAAPLAVAANPTQYVFVDLGQSKAKNGCAGLPTSGSCKETDVSVRVGLGYQFNDTLGFEGAYLDAGKATAPNGGLTSSVKESEWQFMVTGAVPLPGKFSAVGRAGLSAWKLNASAPAYSATGNDFLVGIGAQYDVDPSFSVRAQYETHNVGNVTTGQHKLNTLSVGIIAKF